MRELVEERAQTVSEMRQLNDLAEKENRDLTDEESANYSKYFEDVEVLKSRIERREKLDQQEAELAAVAAEAGDDDAESRDGGGSALLAPIDAVVGPRGTPEYRHAFGEFLRTKNLAPEYADVLDCVDIRALQVDSDEAGGYTVMSEQFLAQVIQAVDDMTHVRSRATVHTVPNAQSLGIPSLDADPADPTWTSELSTGSEDSTMDFGKRELRPHPLAQFIKVSNPLLRRSTIGAEALVRERLSYKLATVQENAFLNGSGAMQPLGVFVASDNGIPTGRDFGDSDNTTTAMVVDGLKDTKYGLKQQYRFSPTSAWMFHRSGVEQISKLKDGEGRYLWAESIRVGEPDRLLNIPVLESEFAPSTFTTGLYVGILGDWKFYAIADALGGTIQRLDELYAITNQVGFISRVETDGLPTLGEAFARVKLG